jgi:hypothetical protein
LKARLEGDIKKWGARDQRAGIPSSVNSEHEQAAGGPIRHSHFPRCIISVDRAKSQQNSRALRAPRISAVTNTTTSKFTIRPRAAEQLKSLA